MAYTGHEVLLADLLTRSQTLYVAKGQRFDIHERRYRMLKSVDRIEAVIIASEPLSDAAEVWDLVPRNHLVTVSPELHVDLPPL